MSTYDDKWDEATGTRDVVKDSVNEFKNNAEDMALQAVTVLGTPPTVGGALGVQPPAVTTPSGLDWTAQTLPPLSFAYSIDGLSGFDLGSGLSLDRYDQPTDLYLRHDDTNGNLFADLAGWELTRFLPNTSDKPVLDFGILPTVTQPDIGEQLPIVAPDAPELSALQVPDAPGYNAPPIGISINPASLPSLANEFDYASDRYSPQYIAQVVTKAQEMMAGAMLIPSHVWDALWARSHGRLERQVQGAILEAESEFASRGWGRPGGSLNAARARIRSEAMGKSHDINLEKSIQQATQVREDAIKGFDVLVTIDSVLEVFHAHNEERALRAAVEANNAALAVYNAAVQAYKVTELEADQLQILLAELEMKSELSELEAYGLQLKGVELLSRIDVNKVELYKAAWSGEETKQKAFSAWVESVKTGVEAQKVAVEAYGENAKAQNTRMQAWVSEWDAYVKYLEGTKTKAGLAETRSSHFGRRVGFYQAADQSEARRHDADIQRLHKIPLERSQLLLARHEADLKEMAQRLDALLKPFAAQYQALGVLSQGEAARVESNVRRYSTEIQNAGLTLQARAEHVKEALSYWQTYQQAWSGWQGAYAGVLGQLGSAYAAAANISMGANSSIDFGSNVSSTYGRSHQYGVSVGVSVDEVTGGLDLNPPL